MHIRLDAEDYMYRRDLLVDPSELEPVDPCELHSSEVEVVSLPRCPSCNGSGKIEWTDDEGWQHEAPCETCSGEGEVNG
ncbi:hypothetical protein AB0I84_47630 [Streptomyces spectabilis]|uniref:hypothetical protein n=1 Tax=Streptomyces spectabilis TaxID=68270 RepID=UPI0033CC4D93